MTAARAQQADGWGGRRPEARPSARTAAVMYGTAACVAALALLAACGPPSAPQAPARQGELRLSILALGDTGKPPWLGFTRPGQLAVGWALEAEHAREPADLLLFLGDNFYYDGLRQGEVARRVEANLVRPYCAFLRLDGACSAEVADACGVPEAQRHPVPILAVLGNHDHHAPESERLERERVPCYVPNWRVPKGVVDTVDLDAGVTLVLYDTERIHAERAYASLSDAIRRARGPWIVVAAHAPLRDNLAGRNLRDALRAAGRTVHVLLAGHEHNLQIGRPLGPGAPLQVVAGGGSEGRRIKVPLIGAEFASITPGFARVDLVRDARGEHLEVTLYRAPSLPYGGAASALGTWRVAADGGISGGPASGGAGAGGASAGGARSGRALPGASSGG